MRLGLNIDHIATIRQARGGSEPDPVIAAGLGELAGADGIVCHLREDRRHIQDRDLELLKKTVQTHLNLEMAATHEIVEIAIKTKPDMCTLVPERRQELTTEGGLDTVGLADHLDGVIKQLKDNRIVVSLFIDPVIEQVKMSAKLGANFIELHTGLYADAEDDEIAETELSKIASMALAGHKLGLRISAGHGLKYHNVGRIAKIDYIEELNIGHSIIARASLVGIDRAVRDMKALICAKV
jgi:pyridoxine 5-phosphate synthase